MRCNLIGLKLLAWMLALVLLPPVWAKAPEKNDVRVLIDISGSMRKNDPENLRRPALRMLVGLMQPGTRAGVWTFAKWTNPLVPMADVDKAWKEKALAAAEQIKSPGMFTHVERVIEDSTKDWEGEPSTHNRHLVLLTDGMVDVSKDAAESAVSRQRILDELLPRLKALGVKAHTIALSERADHDLMKKLSSSTGGWYQQVDSADNLQRVFLKIFEQVGQPDSVPLEGNKFTVDSSVNEATVLLFRKPGSEDPVLVSPGGEKFTDSDLPAGVAWYRDQGYDLITLSTPQKGEWTLQADIDPDNRVMIVTALKLQTSEIPAHIAVGESIKASAHLSNRGKLVKRKAFLKLLDVRADAMTKAGTDPLGLNDAGQESDEKPGDGRYTMLYREDRPFDEVELLFSVESPTFMREKRYRLAVHEPASITLQGEGEAARVLVEPHDVMRDGLEIQVWQDDPSGAKNDLVADADGGYVLKDPAMGVYALVSGMSKLGNAVQREIGPFYPQGAPPEQEAPVQPEPTPPPEPSPEPEPPAATKAEPEVEQDMEDADGGEDSMLPMIVFASVNLLLVVGGLVAWLIIRKRRGAADDDLLDDFEDEVADAGGASADLGSGDETVVQDAPQPGKGESA